MEDTYIEELQKHLFRYIIIAVFLTLATGTIFYHFIEKWSWLNSYYFSVITLATVGYGDIAPKTDAGKIFTTFYVFTGIGIITTFISALAQRWKMRVGKRINK